MTRYGWRYLATVAVLLLTVCALGLFFRHLLVTYTGIHP